MATYFDSYNSLSSKIIDKNSYKFDLEIKEALNINWKKPTLNKHQSHLTITCSFYIEAILCSFLSLRVCVFFFCIALHCIALASVSR